MTNLGPQVLPLRPDVQAPPPAREGDEAHRRQLRFKRLLAEAKTDAEKALFQGQLDQHLSAARGQRQLVTEVCNKAIAARDPKQTAILTLDRTIDTPVLLRMAPTAATSPRSRSWSKRKTTPARLPCHGLSTGLAATTSCRT